MKKTIYSLIFVIVVAVFTVGSTIAFFADREISEDNIFQAGALDIKVDSEAHYRGLVCIDEFWTDPNPIICEEVVMESGIMIELREGGIYEECVENGFDYGIAKWEWDFDWEEEIFKYIPEGDPNGTNVLGDLKLAEWWSNMLIAGIVWKAGQGVYIAPGGTSGTVSYEDGDENKNISHITFCGKDSYCGDCIWDEETEECDGNLGVPEGFYCTADCELVPKPPCESTWEEVDLEVGVHKFFSFFNIRPGDYGEDTISLHVYDSDAWGRLVIDDVIDAENSCTAPELLDEPDCNPVGDGELLEKTYFYAWLDEGAVPGFQNTGRDENDLGFDLEEGDNIKQENEILIRDTAILNIYGEDWELAQVLAGSYQVNCDSFPENGQNDNGICHGLALDGRLVGGITYYLGLAWDFPAERDNSTQSDSFSFDMTLEVEQWRHNNEPFEQP